MTAQAGELVELPGDDGIPWIGDVDSVISEVRTFLGEDLRQMRSVARPRAWDRHDDIARLTVAAHGGRSVGSTGDGLMATFDGPARAVRCAADLASSVRDLSLKIRAGCHTGEVESAADAVRGIAVHIAARIAALAGPGEVLVSSTVKDVTAGSGLTFDYRGEHALKGVPDTWRLYRAQTG